MKIHRIKVEYYANYNGKDYYLAGSSLFGLFRSYIMAKQISKNVVKRLNHDYIAQIGLFNGDLSYEDTIVCAPNGINPGLIVDRNAYYMSIIEPLQKAINNL